jgi:hypothetical protein
MAPVARRFLFCAISRALAAIFPAWTRGPEFPAAPAGHAFFVLYRIFTAALPELHLEQVPCDLKRAEMF